MRPLAALYEPGAHVVQPVCCAAVLYCPAEQLVQAPAATAEYFPGLHAVHTVVDDEYRPAPHAEQAEAPVPLAMYPAAHARHADADVVPLSVQDTPAHQTEAINNTTNRVKGWCEQRYALCLCHTLSLSHSLTLPLSHTLSLSLPLTLILILTRSLTAPSPHTPQSVHVRPGGTRHARRLVASALVLSRRTPRARRR